MNKRTLQEYKKDVFDKLNEQQKLEFLYEISGKCCDYEEIIGKAIEYIKENKAKTYPPYGDNEDTDYDICLVESEINELIEILKGE